MEIIKSIESIKSSIYSKQNIWKGILLAIGVVVILTRYFKFDKSIVQGVLLITLPLVIIEMYLKHKSNKLIDLNKVTLYKLYSIQKFVYNYVESQRLKNPNLTEMQIEEVKKKQKLDYMYLDANIINFLYDVLYLNEYNPDVFYLLTKSINNVLHLRYMIEYYYNKTNKFPENCYTIYEQINIEILEAMNYMHSFIFSIPKMNKMYQQHKVLQDRLFILLKRHSQFAKQACILKKQQEGINNDTKIIQNSSDPRGIDTIEPNDSHNIYV